jgi:hypothetical protein
MSSLFYDIMGRIRIIDYRVWIFSLVVESGSSTICSHGDLEVESGSSTSCSHGENKEKLKILKILRELKN